jgi:hypothetical protein
MIKTPLVAMRVGSLDDEAVWELHEKFIYEASDGYQNALIIVPRGFQTDFASVPRIPLAYLAAGNTAHEAAVVHDYLYREGSRPVMSRELADKVFLAVMEEMGVDAWRRISMYRAVRMFAGHTWKRRSVMDRLVT